MSPPTAMPDQNFDEDPLAVAEAREALESVAKKRPIVAEPDVAGEEDEDDEDDEDEEDEDEEDDDDDDDDDEEDATDEDGNKIVKEQAALAPGRSISPNAGSATDAETHAAPNVSADRTVPVREAEAGRRPHPARTAPLGIKEIENLEDDAMGG
jgi:hypothetical protein